LYLAGLFEIIFQFDTYFPRSPISLAYIQVYTFGFVLLVTALLRKPVDAQVSLSLASALLSACIALYLFSISQNFSFQQLVLTTGSLKGHFIATQILIALLAAVIFYRLAIFLKIYNAARPYSTAFRTWFLSAAVIIYLSVEVHLLANHVFFSPQTSLDDIARVYNKTGLAILWGTVSFAFMWLGMRYKYRPLRIFSLTLFSITLVKLFVFDIRNIPVGGKIAAFFCLGVLLLVISFMYQRLKRILIEDEKQLAAKQ
jgi:uncharacterized membrane protein